MNEHVPTYKRHRFPPEIIGHAIWLYFRFALSYRDVEELLAGLRQEWDDTSGRRGDGRREGGLDCGQMAANSAMMVAQRSWNMRRRSPSDTTWPDRATARKYWRCSSKAGQKRAAEVKLPKPRIG